MQKLKLSIPEPCHENWHHMTPTDQGRFCNACAKEVVDFSMMTDTEVLNYFTTLTHEKVCGRALPSQLERTFYRLKDPKKRLFWYWNYIVMFFMFFGKANAAKAQGGIKPVTEINPVKANDIRGEIATVNVIKQQGSRVITGRITDVNGNPASFSSIKIKGTNREIIADANGIYSLKVKQNDTLFISAASFKAANVPVGTASIINAVLENDPASSNHPVVYLLKGHRHARFTRKAIAVNTDSLYVMDGVMTTQAKSDSLNPDDISDITRLAKNESVALFGNEASNGAVIITTRKAKEISLTEVVVTSGGTVKGMTISTCTVTKTNFWDTKTNLIQDTINTLLNSFNNSLKIYPNPVQRGEQINISLKLKQTGSYQIYVSDAAGRTVLQKQINVSTKEFTEMLPVDNRWSSGVYYISIIDNKNQFVSKKSFIVR